MDVVAVVGASLAGLRAVEELRAAGFPGDIVVIGAETHLPYDRPPLTKNALTQPLPLDHLRLGRAAGSLARWVLGTAVVSSDLAARTLTLADGREQRFDGLIVTTGCAPRIPSAAAAGQPGVQTLRTWEDLQRLRADLSSPGRRVLVVGAGYIGCEIASSCRSLGHDVTVVDPLPLPLGRVVGDLIGRRLSRLLTDHGVDLRLGRGLAELTGSAGRVYSARLTDGSVTPADVVVVAAGVLPAVSWLDGNGLDLTDGLLCDESLRIRHAAMATAAGDVARWSHRTLGGTIRVEHWTNASLSAAAAARTLLADAEGTEAGPYLEVPSFWSDMFGRRLQGFGLLADADHVEIEHGDLEQFRFVARYVRDGRDVGILGCGMPRQLAAAYRQLSRSFDERAEAGIPALA